MFDLADNMISKALTARFHAVGEIIPAVCYGSGVSSMPSSGMVSTYLAGHLLLEWGGRCYPILEGRAIYARD